MFSLTGSVLPSVGHSCRITRTAIKTESTASIACSEVNCCAVLQLNSYIQILLRTTAAPHPPHRGPHNKMPTQTVQLPGNCCCRCSQSSGLQQLHLTQQQQDTSKLQMLLVK